MSPRTRRLALAAGALAGLAGLAGCSSESDGDGATPAGDTPAPADEGTEAGLFGGSGGDQCEELRWAALERAELEAIRGELPGGHPDERVAEARAVGEAVRDSVVVVRDEFGAGTGWFVDETHVVTNAHNLAAAIDRANEDALHVQTIDGDESSVEVVEYEASFQPDVALLRTDLAGPPLSMAESADLAPGTPLVQVGHPGGVGFWVVSLGLHVEAVAGGRGTGDGPPSGGDVVRTLKSSVPGRVGNSGSPLCTLDGRVVGMTHGSEQRGQAGGDAPRPAEPVVYDWPIAPRAWTVGDPIEAVRERLGR